MKPANHRSPDDRPALCAAIVERLSNLAEPPALLPAAIVNKASQ